jgi:two-component system chemotaxis response regulator CheB
VKVVRHLRRRDADPLWQESGTFMTSSTSAAPEASKHESALRSGQKRPPAAGGQIAVVAIAASTGGPPALQRCLSELPTGFPAPILVVQHISAGFTDGFVAWLNSSVALNVKLAEHAERLQAGTVYIAGEGRHLEVGNGKIRLNEERPPISGFRPSGTPLFESVAKEYGKAALALILTGMGRDGVDGLRAIKQLGGRVLAQNEASCVVFGMPRAAIDEGLADDVLAIEAMPSAVLKFVLPGVDPPTSAVSSRQAVPVRAPDDSVSERS